MSLMGGVVEELSSRLIGVDDMVRLSLTLLVAVDYSLLRYNIHSYF